MVPDPRPVGACLAGDQAHPQACGSLPCRRPGAPSGPGEPALQAIEQQGTSFAGKARSHRKTLPFARKPVATGEAMVPDPRPVGACLAGDQAHPQACGSLPCRRSSAPSGPGEPALQAIEQQGTSFAGKARSHRKTLPFARKPAPTGEAMVPDPRPVGACLAGDQAAGNLLRGQGPLPQEDPPLRSQARCHRGSHGSRPEACGSLPCRRPGAPSGLWEPALKAIERTLGPVGACLAGDQAHPQACGSLPCSRSSALLGLWEPALQAIEQQGTSFAGKARSHRKTLPFARKPAPTGEAMVPDPRPVGACLAGDQAHPQACGSLPCRRSSALLGLWEPALQAIEQQGTSFAGKARSHRKTLPFARKPAPTGKPSGPVRRASARARAARHPPRSAGGRSRARWRRSSSTALRRDRAGRSRPRRPRRRRP